MDGMEGEMEGQERERGKVRREGNMGKEKRGKGGMGEGK